LIFPCVSLRRQHAGAYQFPHAIGLLHHEVGGVLRRAADDVHAQITQPAANFRLGQSMIDAEVQFLHDRLRRARRHRHAVKIEGLTGKAR
jgi:hypothetical protein